MRSRLTYLLLLCLLFFKGNSCVLLREHKKLHHNSFAQNIQNDNSTHLASYQNLVLFSQDSLYRDDDDNEPGSPKKKAASFTTSTTHNKVFALSCLSIFFKTNHLPGKHFWSYPDKYLFIGVIKL
jgi:hypothetical protein